MTPPKASCSGLYLQGQAHFRGKQQVQQRQPPAGACLGSAAAADMMKIRKEAGLDDMSSCEAGNVQEMTPPRTSCNGLYIHGRQPFGSAPSAA